MTAEPDEVPDFLADLARRAEKGEDVLLERIGDLEPGSDPRHGAVLVLIAGSSPQDAAIALEERGHSLRSQPGQFALPGGRRDPGDRDDVHTALREAREEIGLDEQQVRLLGPFAPIPMPWRDLSIRPVLAWAPRRPPVGVVDPVEVERVLWAPLVGPGSLTHRDHRVRAVLDGREFGTAHELPDDVFVWGFTAMILEAVLDGLDLPPRAEVDRRREVPSLRRREGSRENRRARPGPPL